MCVFSELEECETETCFVTLITAEKTSEQLINLEEVSLITPYPGQPKTLMQCVLLILGGVMEVRVLQIRQVRGGTWDVLMSIRNTHILQLFPNHTYNNTKTIENSSPGLVFQFSVMKNP